MTNVKQKSENANITNTINTGNNVSINNKNYNTIENLNIINFKRELANIFFDLMDAPELL